MQFTLKQSTVSYASIGSGSLTALDGISSGAVVSPGTAVTFIATPAEGWHFGQWRYTKSGSGTSYPEGVVSGGSHTLTLEMPASSIDVKAQFIRDSYTLILTDSDGTVNAGLQAWYMGDHDNDTTTPDEKTTVQSGDSIRGDTEIYISAAPGYAFKPGANWLAAGSSGSVETVEGIVCYSLTLTQNTEVRRDTVQGGYTVTVNWPEAPAFIPESVLYSVNGASSVTLTEGASFSVDGGDSLNFSAVAPDTYALRASVTGWQVNGEEISGSSYSCESVTSDLTITPILIEKTNYMVTLSAPSGETRSYTVVYNDGEGAAGYANGTKIKLYTQDKLTVTAAVPSGKAVSHWMVNEKTDMVYHAAYTLSSISKNTTVYPVFTSSTSFSVNWSESESTTGFAVTPLAGSVSPVAASGSYRFTVVTKDRAIGEVYANDVLLIPDANGMYTISSVTANQTITVRPAAVGVTVGGTDVSALLGNGWSYDYKTGLLTVTGDQLTIGGTSIDGRMSLVLGEGVHDVTLSGLVIQNDGSTESVVRSNITESSYLNLHLLGKSSLIMGDRKGAAGYGLNVPGKLSVDGSGSLSVKKAEESGTQYTFTGIQTKTYFQSAGTVSVDIENLNKAEYEYIDKVNTAKGIALTALSEKAFTLSGGTLNVSIEDVSTEGITAGLTLPKSGGANRTITAVHLNGPQLTNAEYAYSNGELTVYASTLFNKLAAGDEANLIVKFTDAPDTQTKVTATALTSALTLEASDAAAKGSTVSFTAKRGDAPLLPQAVIWAVEGASSANTAFSGAVLTIGGDESATQLKAKATHGEDTVTKILELSEYGIRITPETVAVERFDAAQFTAEVLKNGVSDEGHTITWSLSNHFTDATTISDEGVLSVSGDEKGFNNVLHVVASCTIDGQVVAASSTVTIVPAVKAYRLSALGVTDFALTPAFSPVVTAYTLEVPSDTQSVTVSGAAAHGLSTVNINGAAATSQEIDLAQGGRVITVTCVGPDNTEHDYTIAITKALPVPPPTPGDGGSTGGGTAGGGSAIGGSVPGGPAAATVPVSGHQSADISATVSDGNARLTMTGENLQTIIVSGTANLTADASGLESVSSVTIPKNAMEIISQTQGLGLTVVTKSGSVTLSHEAISGMGGGQSDLTVVVERTPAERITDEQLALIGNGAVVLELRLWKGDEQIHDFGGGMATVSVPYTGQPAEDMIAWRMVTGSDGSIDLQPIAVRINSENGCYEFDTGSFSLYTLARFPFTDIPDSAWYYEDVVYAYTNTLFSGASQTRFAPGETMTRGMLIAVLWRMEGQPQSNPAAFADVPGGKYYESAVAWGAANGIIGGYGNGLFGPDNKITREQMAAILYRYAQFKGVEVSVGETANILPYKDVQQISEYAVPAMRWASGTDLMQGSAGSLMPKGGATRAQVAAILHRFCENVKK